MRSFLELRHACPVCVLLLALCFPGTPFGASRTFEYLCINASEGSASGGHAAIKFGGDVFHFQHVPPGLLRITKEDFGWFRFQYGYQENRTIRSHSIEVSEETFKWLNETFNRRLLVQDEQFAALDAMDGDLRLIQALQNSTAQRNSNSPADDAPTLALKALGYFFAERWQPQPARPLSAEPVPVSSLLQTLKAAIPARYGEDFLATKQRQTWNRLLTLKPEPREPAGLDIAEDRFSPAGYSFAQHYVDLLTDLAALEVLARSIPPRDDAIRRTDIPEFRLTREAVAALDGYRQTLTADLLRLLSSERTDWGYPLLAGIARLHALERSIASGRLAILDRYPAAESTSSARDEAGSALISALFERTRQAYTSAKSGLISAQPLDERRYGQLEVSANLFLETRRGMVQPHAARLLQVDMTPSRPAAASLIALPLTAEQLAGYRQALTTRREAYLTKLMSLYGYNLMARNCVTEIFRVINQAIAKRLEENGEPRDADTELARITAESERLLGGYVDETSLNLIPFVSFQTVGKSYRVRSTEELLPYREEHIRQAYHQAMPFLVDMEESNVISSAIYRWHGDDAAFLFFTQDAVWSRPILGSFNLAVALGQTLTGLFALPWDSGENLRKSLKGVFVSIPELFFFNIRKGSFPLLPPIDPAD